MPCFCTILAGTQPSQSSNLKINFHKFYSFLRLLKMPVETKPIMRFAKLTEHAFEPLKGSEKAAGFDLKR